VIQLDGRQNQLGLQRQSQQPRSRETACSDPYQPYQLWQGEEVQEDYEEQEKKVPEDSHQREGGGDPGDSSASYQTSEEESEDRKVEAPLKKRSY
jgi:hypothetical protein